MMQHYGAHPDVLMESFDPEWKEYMHFLYLPVVIPGHAGLRLPERLEFLRTVINHVHDHEVPPGEERYIYVTARRGWASPGNPLNRPGWHADGFGSDDVNYIWSDAFPTMFAVGDLTLPEEIETDHVRSVTYWEGLVDNLEWFTDNPSPEIDPLCREVYQSDPLKVYRLDPSVVHATAEIPAPGGNRSFFKISVSRSKYNLAGNSHNYLFDYDWKMHDRDALRNDPAYAGGDSVPD